MISWEMWSGRDAPRLQGAQDEGAIFTRAGLVGGHFDHVVGHGLPPNLPCNGLQGIISDLTPESAESDDPVLGATDKVRHIEENPVVVPTGGPKFVSGQDDWALAGTPFHFHQLSPAA